MEAEGIKGCIANGISEQAANAIYDSMVDFAKYAFNKSHAAAYAVISVQTAWLKYYYPVEFMAALMTSVIDNSTKASEYLYHCKEMGIPVLSPDINSGQGEFTAEGDNVRYGLYAIKALGRPVIDRIIEERTENGLYKTLQDFIERTTDRDVNKRAVENLIKAGACDSLDGTRKQMVIVSASLIDQVAQQKKNSLAGQMSLFDLVSDDVKKEYQIHYPDVGEYSKEELLGYEKEVLGIYLSGHPMEEYMTKWKKNVTASAGDFLLDEETGETKAKDNEKVIVGGMIAEKTIKYTKNNQAMAFITIEDITGTVEVIIFPKIYERFSAFLNEDAKVFVTGRAQIDDERDGKIICDRIIPFEDVQKELWLQFHTKEEYDQKEAELFELLHDSDGSDEVVIYVANPKLLKRLGKNRTIRINTELVNNLTKFLGENNVKVVEKSIENK